MLQGYCVEIFDLNDMPLEKLAGAISLAYDKVNSRVTVQALFPEPICLKAIISFEGQKLPNGEFDIIVLSSKSLSSILFLFTQCPTQYFLGSDNTLVHKNIASRKHNICYEAKLLSIFGQPKAKPRKVLCYIGPKQVILIEN